ncbi:hypothetical protein RPMA_26090 [Tardiphaga alba]|uniref:NlpC/P60 family protein n=1 Tax=Tardiphaga alba TaxID=340268 RepID=A0ABX8ADT9_9BRAD|nr:hypothetical protein [Tardiphaga alba]QUS41918.1 hypothetical protein RPMA_26090 [Tardiphaga alba]
MSERIVETAIASIMWALVERYTGKVGYKGAVKAEGLSFEPPVIDCSGWAGLLLTSAMQAANHAAQRTLFTAEQCAGINTWSDRMIEVIEARTGVILAGDAISADTLPPFALIGLCQEGGAWATNHPRPRGITHVVQLVRRPGDDAVFVSEAQGWAAPFGLRLLPLAEWIEITRPWLTIDKAWAVDPFAPTRHAW